MVKWLLLLLCVGACTQPKAARPVDRAALLVAAVRGDSADVVRQLLDAGVSPDTIAPDGTRPLTEAARHGRIAAAEALLYAGASSDLADSAGSRPFDYAVEEGHRELAVLLVRQAARDAGANPQAIAWFDALSGSGNTVPDWHRVLDGEIASLGLICAVLNRRDDVAASLRRAAGIPNRTGYVALVLAARFGDEAAVADLLGASANPDAEVSGHWHETPLMAAAEDGYVAIGRRLIRAGARVDHVDDRGQTALIWAVREGETDFARLLLDAGADPTRRDEAGDSALDIAHRINHTDLIALLEEHRGKSRRKT
jgi:ankyrin repeat protein